MMRIFHRWLVVLTLLFSAAGVPTMAASVAQAEPCPDVQVVFARGTFEPVGVGETGQSFVDALRARTAGRSVDVYAVNYPASLDFATAADGVIDASNKVRDVATVCPDTEIVIGGYSQGAAVAAYITADSVPAGFALPPGLTGPMPASVSDHVAAATLFGKPSTGFLQMIYTGAPPITVGSHYVDKTLDLCIPTDPVCSPTGGDNGTHTAYAHNGMTDQAADFVAGKLPAADRART
ncbi:cutinase family protein [Mycolicibacterium confluentis]|uniref:Cutinase n=1 Tax=Mycolicibacterium confluentis TaxID=28047 RepID=A0A7I7Y5J1_9MYCO|nr:cutinase [Mycolicibacterium confluentis]BBZ36171.1 serine esterase [Mycolicibacterium confluentis]